MRLRAGGRAGKEPLFEAEIEEAEAPAWEAVRRREDEVVGESWGKDGGRRSGGSGETSWAAAEGEALRLVTKCENMRRRSGSSSMRDMVGGWMSGWMSGWMGGRGGRVGGGVNGRSRPGRDGCQGMEEVGRWRWRGGAGVVLKG